MLNFCDISILKTLRRVVRQNSRVLSQWSKDILGKIKITQIHV